jgi:hypothetical protein
VKQYKTVLGGVASVGAALALFTAPIAAAGPAPSGVERDYLQMLGGGTSEQEDLAMQLGYLTCALNMKGGSTIAGTEPFLNAALTTGVCDYVSLPASQADLRQDLAARLQEANAPGIADWNDTDDDNDDVSNSNDSDPFNKNYN